VGAGTRKQAWIPITFPFRSRVSLSQDCSWDIWCRPLARSRRSRLCSPALALLEANLVSLWVGLPGFVFLVFFAAALMSRLAVYGRRLRQPDAPSVLARDPRPPVLFLRSFRDEDIVDLTSRTGRGSMRRSEEALCTALRRVGPVIAIGRPGEHLPETGAARLYVGDHDWQKAVRHFLAQAAAVVIVVGTSPGVWWEIDAALESVDRRRLLFFFPI
jgi:hypothetical protein